MERCLVLFSKDYRYSVRKINIFYLCYMNDILRLHNIVNLLMIISKYILWRYFNYSIEIPLTLTPAFILLWKGGLKSEEYWIKDIYAAHFPNFLNFHKYMYLDLKTEFFNIYSIILACDQFSLSIISC